MKKLFVYLLLLFAVLQACKKETSSLPSPIVISKNITTATTFDKVTPDGAVDYIVTVPIEISANVIIKPGVIISFKSGADITVVTGGSLNATGTLTEPIYFYGEQNVRGYWGGLYFKSTSTSNKLIYCVIQNAGGNDHTIPAIKGGVIVYGTGLLQIMYSSIISSGGYGLYLTEASSALTNSMINVYANNANAPVTIPVSSLAYLDSTSTYTGNDVNYIDGSDDGPISTTQTWQKLGVPYLLPEGILQITAAVTVSPGTVIKARQGTGLQVQSGGSLKALGTASKGITFQGNEAVKGFWAGIQFNSTSTNNNFDYVTISDGGSSTSGFVIPIRQANIEVSETGKLTITHSTISNSLGYGIRVVTGGTITQTNNTFSNNTSGTITP